MSQPQVVPSNLLLLDESFRRDGFPDVIRVQLHSVETACLEAEELLLRVWQTLIEFLRVVDLLPFPTHQCELVARFHELSRRQEPRLLKVLA